MQLTRAPPKIAPRGTSFSSFNKPIRASTKKCSDGRKVPVRLEGGGGELALDVLGYRLDNIILIKITYMIRSIRALLNNREIAFHPVPNKNKRFNPSLKAVSLLSTKRRLGKCTNTISRDAPSRFEGICDTCGQYGHRMRYCIRNQPALCTLTSLPPL